MIDNIFLGFSTALTLENFTYSFIGVFVGNLVGVLPGIGALAAISMLLPITYGIEPAGALMMLAGLYYGTSYGGATTTILLNLPGTASHAVVCLDGHPMAKQGKAGSALLIAMLSSFVGATAGIVLMMAFGPLLVALALKFGSAEYFSLMFLGLLAASTLTSGSPLKGVAMVLVGLIFGVVGTDVNTGIARFTFGIPELQDGLAIVAVAMGLFGIADVLQNVNRIGEGSVIQKEKIGWRSLRLRPGELKQSAAAIFRGTGIGAFFGVLPGTGGSIASFMSYAVEKKSAKQPARFGQGAIEGVAGPEAANSAAAQTAFIPTLTLGIPGDAVMALMLGAMMIHEIQPGPQMMVEHPTVFWGLIASFWVGNLILLLLNVPLIGMWVRLLSIPYRLIYPAVLFFICIGVFSANNNLFDVGVVLAIGIFAYVSKHMGFEAAPLLLGVVLGPMMEEHFRRALLLSRGDITVFISPDRPISAACILAALLMIGGVIYKHRKAKRLAVKQLG
ncbi:tripartite tricarboxylate transporter permease [Paenalcaligenes niemegkensis]|uniref:tripartite tricarboxylate transporter permease n=1 Tax=Paenalcaligenes niemegkensis TaxID=2895469 RepID=UPI001EE7B650|nr:tripartite tricarboxylate transporter permease [Paenalcaligenes niemegkensis]MCQ9616136.1 tripartite tricarboxylate transporter permease [Paenalcaligenes niemegkensis]